MAFSTIAQMYALALPAAAFAARPRTVEGVTIATGVLRLTGHGLGFDSLLQFSLEGQAAFGAPANALPGGLAIDANYTADPLSGSNLFRVRPEGGAVISSFTSEPVGPFAIVVDPEPALSLLLDDATARIEEKLTNNAPPIKVDPDTGVYPMILVGICARMAARQAVVALGLQNPQYAAQQKMLLDGAAADDLMLATWLAGRRVNVPLFDQTTENENAALAGNSGPSTGWRTGTL